MESCRQVKLSPREITSLAYDGAVQVGDDGTEGAELRDKLADQSLHTDFHGPSYAGSLPFGPVSYQFVPPCADVPLVFVSRTCIREDGRPIVHVFC